VGCLYSLHLPIKAVLILLFLLPLALQQSRQSPDRWERLSTVTPVAGSAFDFTLPIDGL